MSEAAATVTVLMAVHNGEPFLRQAIESILAQTYEDLELLVVDDASTDGGPALLAEYCDARIRTIANSRRLGLTASLVRGWRDVRSPYVARQDADDVSEPTRLERQVEVLEADRSLGLVASSYVRIDDRGETTAQRPVPTSCTDIRWRLLFLNAFTHSSVTVRRGVAETAGGYDDRYRYAQDYDLWSRIAAIAPVTAVPEPLVRYRASATSMTATFSGAGEEIDAISRRNVQRVAGDGRAFDGVRAAWPLLFGDTRYLELGSAMPALSRARELHAAFTRFYALGAAEARRHRGAVFSRAGLRLLREASRRRDARAAAAGASVAAASVLDLLPRPRREQP